MAMESGVFQSKTLSAAIQKAKREIFKRDGSIGFITQKDEFETTSVIPKGYSRWYADIFPLKDGTFEVTVINF